MAKRPQHHTGGKGRKSQRASLDLIARKFERAADQRLTAAGVLYEQGFGLKSVYLAGYAVECSLKSLILKRTPKRDRRSILELLTQVGARGHDFEYLKGLLEQPPRNCSMATPETEMLRRVASWSSDLRYEVGLLESSVARDFLAAAVHIRDWAGRS